MNTTLINFRVPTELQQTFDLLCRYQSKTRTYCLIELMEQHVSKNHQPIINQLEDIRRINKSLSEIIEIRNHHEIPFQIQIMKNDEDLWEDVNTNNF